MQPMSGRDNYTSAQLRRLIHPGSIAVLGVSNRSTALGTRTLGNLAHFSGNVYPVHPRMDRIGDLQCFPDLKSLPEVPDCAVLALPRQHVEAALQDCCDAGIGGALVFTSDYAEIGTPERRADQARLVHIARDAGVRLLGPNCLGLVNHHLQLALTFARVGNTHAPVDRAIGLVCQSGAMGVGLLQSASRGVSFTHMLTAGNAADVDVADLVRYLADDDACKVIACCFEGFKHADRFMEALAHSRARRKPVVLFKVGVSERGALAALSHTASLAGSQAGYHAMCERHGAVVVDRYEHFLETAAFFAKASPTEFPARGAGIVSVSGGYAILATDAAASAGIELPQPGEDTAKILAAAIPEFGSSKNPCDMTAAVNANPQMLISCVRAFLADPAFATVLVTWSSPPDQVSERVASLERVAAEFPQKVLCVWWTSMSLEGKGSTLVEVSSLPLFRSPHNHFNVVHAWHRWRHMLNVAKDGLADSPERTFAPTIAQKQRLRIGGERAIGERRAKQLLASYGIRPVPELRVSSAAEAEAAAEQFAGPVALKVDSADIPHKTDAGCVVLGVHGGLQVRRAFDEIVWNAKAAVAGATIEGVLVQPMVDGNIEIIVGGTIDPLYGPLLTVGVGGVFTELVRDSVTALAPLDSTEALSMLNRLRAVKLLDGFRGAQPVDKLQLAQALVGVSRFLDNFRDQVEEVEVNPLICKGGDIYAVDALIILRQQPDVEHAGSRLALSAAAC